MPESPATSPNNPQQSLLQKIWPHAAAILIFLAITIFLFLPCFKDGQVVQAGDVHNFQGMSKEIADYRTQYGSEPLWTNAMFGGMPAFQVSTIFYGNLARFMNVVMTLGMPRPANLFFLAMLGIYLLLVVCRVKPWVALIGAVGYALSSYSVIITTAGHNTKLEAMGYFPYVAAGAVLIWQRRYWWGAALTAMAMTCELKANHLQITYYLLLTLFILGIVELIKDAKRKNLKQHFISAGIMIAALSLGFISNASLLWTSNEYAKATTRGGTTLVTNTKVTTGLDEGYAFDWSYGKAETFALLIPDVYGGSSDTRLSTDSHAAGVLKQFNLSDDQLNGILGQMPTYWGDPIFTGGPHYMGAVVCFLFILGLILVTSEWRWWLLSAAVMGILLAWGKNFMVLNNFLFHYFPYYNKFRTVDMTLIVTQFAMPVLGAMAINRIVTNGIGKEELWKKLKLALYITGGITLAVLLAGQMDIFSFRGVNDYKIAQRFASQAGDNKAFGDQMLAAIIKDRKGLLTSDALRSLVFILLCGGLIWAFAKNKIKSGVLIGGVLVLVFADLYLVSKRYLSDDNFGDAQAFNDPEMSQADQYINQNDKTLDYRVFNNTVDVFQDASTSYFHKSVGGYHAAKMRRYQDLIETQFYKSQGVINMMNTRWMIFNGKQGPVPSPNPDASGNAWFPDSLIHVQSPDEEIAAVGPIFEVKSLGNHPLLIDGKTVSSGTISNHDAVSVIEKDTTNLDAYRFAPTVGREDTLALVTITGKDNASHHEFRKASSGEVLIALKRVYDFNPKHEAVVDVKQFPEAAKLQNQPDSMAIISMVSYKPNDLVYQSNSTKDNVAVFSEIYYQPGWNATLDDKPVSHFRVNYVLRGMMIPAGKHKIEFVFHPESYFTGEKIAMAGSALVLLLFFGVLGKSVLEMVRKK